MYNSDTVTRQWQPILDGGSAEVDVDDKATRLTFVEYIPRARDPYGEAFQSEDDGGTLIVKDDWGQHYRVYVYESSFDQDAREVFQWDVDQITRVKPIPKTVYEWRPV